MKKKYITLGVAGVLILLTTVGGTLAALNTDTEGGAGAATAGISLENIAIDITGDAKITRELYTADLVPGGVWQNPYHAVCNTAADGYTIYAKVVVDRYWTERTEGETPGEYADISSEVAEAYVGRDGEQIYDMVDTETEQYVLNDWIVTYADEEQMVLYYRKPLKSGECSSDFLTGILFRPEMGNAYADKEYHIEITATAVQANNSKDAIAAELGVFPAFDEEGNLTWVSESRPANYGE